MAGTISRRNFLKQSSIAGLTAAVAPAASISAAPSSAATKSRVVIAKDPDCISGGKTVEEKLIKMFDNAIMVLTGETDTGKAYEALFPKGVTESTKIFMKRNDISGRGSVNTEVTNAFKKCLTQMLGGTFKAENITVHCRAGNLKSNIQANDYLINCPVCWIHGSDYGVTLSLKNTMIYLGAASQYHSANKKWLHEVSLDPVIKERQVLSLMDCVCGNNQNGPGTGATFEAATVILSKDLVAVDYQALRLMEKQSKPNTRNIGVGDTQLKAAETAGLGTCTAANMEVIEISPPWPSTGIIHDPDPSARRLDVRTMNHGGTFEFVLPEVAYQVEMSIFDMKGCLVWNTRQSNVRGVVWHKQSAYGFNVPNGFYSYRISNGQARSSGIVMIAR